MIIFNYKISDILNNAQVLSLYRAGSVLEKGSDNLVDDTAVSDEDESILKKYLRAGCNFIADTLSGYANNLLGTDGETVLEAFEFDITYETVEHQFLFRVNLPETFRASALLLIDESIKDALENYILYRVAKHKMIEGETYLSDWEAQRGQIRSYLTRRTAPVKRVYKLF